MKHRRSIDLRQPEIEDISGQTLAELKEWERLGAYCPRCEREGWLDRWALERRFGKYASLGQIAFKIRCAKCGSREGNRFFTGRLPR
ncbi:hypothetical protein IFT84_20665 [Rhizobium sp. CFBP 8762]|uniref:hypothetical protein n=1 Tax=Rhizobium sp. CFBP 8762 TaxID=2775279 RepID=UPI001780120E|nr:hypothetical protein [Rhizobium sp. CFBP 8762]MBD8556926.1 hypothetical protein [Rhizobium sp. CFBP 8762]